MDSNSITFNEMSNNYALNRDNFNITPLLHKQIKLTKKINIYPDSIIRHRSPTNLGSYIGNNNVHLKNSKKYLKNRQIIDISNISNDQNINTLNFDIFPRNTNITMAKINQNFSNTNQNKQKYFQENLTENNVSVNNTFTEFKEQKEIKEKKGNYQYIVKKVKKVNQPILSEKRQFNDLGKNSTKEEREININKIRQELISIHDNRKYNYDKKVQKINIKKIPIPQSQKLVERILGISEKKENIKKDEFKTTSKFSEQALPENKIPLDENNIEQMNNENKDKIIQDDTLKKNIQSINLDINKNQMQNEIFKTGNNQNIKINNYNFNIQQDLNNNQIQNQKQMENIQQDISSNYQNQPQIQLYNKQLKQFHNILLPPPTNNNDDLKNINQQTSNKEPYQTITFVQKLSPIINNSNKNILKASPRIDGQNNNFNNNFINSQINKIKQDKEIKIIYPKNDSNISNLNDLYEPKNSDEIDINENPYININSPIKKNIQFQKVIPTIKGFRNISPMGQSNLNLISNTRINKPNLNINMDQIQNMKMIKQIKINESRIFTNPQQNMNYSKNINYINQYDTNYNQNFPQDWTNNENINRNIIIPNMQIINNNNGQNINMTIQKNINQKVNQNNIHQKFSEINNIDSNFDEDDFASVQFLEQIPNDTIGQNITIKNGKAYYLNQNIKENNSQQPKIPNNQMANMNNQNHIYNSNNCNILNKNNINNNQIMNRQIINNAQNINITRIQNSPQNKIPIKPQNNSQTQVKNAKNIIRKKKVSRVAKLLQEKDPKEPKKALQYQVERNRPVYAVPQSKKRAVSQGKPFTLINKYYDENYILEDDKEEDDKNEEINNLHIEKNMSYEEEKSSN